jgi:PAS domain S-box-containing protein
LEVAIETKPSRRSSSITSANPILRVVVQACLVAALCYVAGRLGGALIVQPQMVSPLWLGNVILASVLVLVRQRLWPVLLLAGLAGFVFYDLQGGAPAHAIIWLFISNAVEVFTAAWCLRTAFGGAPRLNSVKALVKYTFYAVFLAPFVGAFFGALSNSSNYWATWKVAFFSEALGFLTLMPAILGWAREIQVGAKRTLAYYLEETALLIALIVLGQLAFASPLGSTLPTLLYSLVPLLLWCTLRFGSTGVSTSMIAIAFVSIWGAIHGRGPFTGPGPLINILSLQLFLFFTAAPFMALAALVEESKDTEQVLRQRETDLNEAQRLAQTGSWQWDPRSDTMIWSAELYRMAGYDPKLPAPSFKDHEQFFPPESWARLKQSVEESLRTGMPYELDLEALRLDGTKLWLTTRGEAVLDAAGHPVYLRGTTQDITDRKRSEEALVSMSGRLITAQEEERTRIARELHDDLSQRMAILQIGLEQFRQGMPGISPEARQQLHTIEEAAREVSSDMHNLSYQLHPARLELLGLVTSLRGFCGEFSAQHKLTVQFVHSDIPREIPKDVTLCLYRITQEALQNVVKHSGAEEVEVELSGHSDEIDLCISDSGRGFDVESAKGVAGLGLISMRERLRPLGGQLSIESEPSHGTRIRVRVPQTSFTADADNGT